MNERLLQFIWRFQYFDKMALSTTDGDTLFILHPGTLNTNQGPDFLEAKIKAGKTIWAGHVELHVYSSDWVLHGHSNDVNYQNIILHVVWENNTAPALPFPVLELKGRVAGLLLKRYSDLMKAPVFIPCEKIIQQAPPITWLAWKESLLVERLQQKATAVYSYLQQNNSHWEETFWWMLAKNFGAVVNSGSFESIARSLPLSILARHKNQLHQTEALLFGQALLLAGDFTEDYPILLQKEYRFLQKKYALVPLALPLHFLRMRPSNFPGIRLAQLAMLIHHSSHLFSKIKETVLLKDVIALLDVTANDYWHYHYRFDEAAAYKPKRMGRQMITNILINTVAPILFAYGHMHREDLLKERALKWLEEMQPEKNVITNGFAALGIENKNAWDSQALIQLKKNYCSSKRCLECAVGNKLLK